MKTINSLCIKQTNEKDKKKEGKFYKKKKKKIRGEICTRRIRWKKFEKKK